jgi:hypothetical protein
VERLRTRLHPQYELLSAAERDAIVAPHMHEHLQPLGLAGVGARTWVDGSRPPVRRMFELRLLKGAGMRAQWGFSLDFVPHISGGRVQWHRTNKAAMLDVIFDPSEEVLPRLTYIRGAAQLHDDLNRALPIAVEKAKESWQRGETTPGLLALVREVREQNTNCFPFDMYTQLPLAYAFLSARVGDLGSAERELNRYLSRLKVEDEIATKLRKLAREYAGNAADTY